MRIHDYAGHAQGRKRIRLSSEETGPKPERHHQSGPNRARPRPGEHHVGRKQRDAQGGLHQRRKANLLQKRVQCTRYEHHVQARYGEHVHGPGRGERGPPVRADPATASKKHCHVRGRQLMAPPKASLRTCRHPVGNRAIRSLRRKARRRRDPLHPVLAQHPQGAARVSARSALPQRQPTSASPPFARLWNFAPNAHPDDDAYRNAIHSGVERDHPAIL